MKDTQILSQMTCAFLYLWIIRSVFNSFLVCRLHASCGQSHTCTTVHALFSIWNEFKQYAAHGLLTAGGSAVTVKCRLGVDQVGVGVGVCLLLWNTQVGVEVGTRLLLWTNYPMHAYTHVHTHAHTRAHTHARATSGWLLRGAANICEGGFGALQRQTLHHPRPQVLPQGLCVCVCVSLTF